MTTVNILYDEDSVLEIARPLGENPNLTSLITNLMDAGDGAHMNASKSILVTKVDTITAAWAFLDSYELSAWWYQLTDNMQAYVIRTSESRHLKCKILIIDMSEDRVGMPPLKKVYRTMDVYEDGLIFYYPDYKYYDQLKTPVTRNFKSQAVDNITNSVYQAVYEKYVIGKALLPSDGIVIETILSGGPDVSLRKTILLKTNEVEEEDDGLDDVHDNHKLLTDRIKELEIDNARLEEALKIKDTVISYMIDRVHDLSN